MYNKSLIKATVITTAAILVAGLTSCGKEEVSEPQVAVEATTETTVEETVEQAVESATGASIVTDEAATAETSEATGFEERLLYEGYVAQVIEDNAPVTYAYDGTSEAAQVPVDTIVNVTHELYQDGKVLDVVKIKYTDDKGNEVVGYIKDKYLTFDIQVADSVADPTADALNGVDDASETPSEQAEETETTASVTMSKVDKLETPVTKYTNTNANVRSQADKNSVKVTTLGTNTAVTVTGTSGDWSEVEIDGGFYFIKSNLLSDTQTKTQTASQSQSQTQTQTQPQGGTSSQQAQSDAELLKQLEALTGADNSTYNPIAGQGTGASGYYEGNVTFE